MDWYIRAFIRASLVWFTIGVLFGLAIAFQPSWVVYRPAHAHMTVVGFLSMLVFGVGYQLLPRMFGHPLASARLAVAHLVMANLGLASLVLGFLVRPSAPRTGTWLEGAGGTLFAVGALSWVVNLWRTFNAAEARQRAKSATNRPSLPSVGQD